MSERGDWDRWITFFATGLRDPADDTARKIDEMVTLHRRARELWPKG